MKQDFDSPDSPFIRVARSGETSSAEIGRESARGKMRQTTVVRDSEGPPSDIFFDEEMEEEPAPREAAKRTRGSRPMPKRLSEEQEEAPRSRSSRTVAARTPAKATTTEQLPLDLKSPRAKPDQKVQKRHVLGLSFITIAILMALAIVTYTPNDAPMAETKLSQIPAIITQSNPEVNAHADMVHNSLGLIGAMMADFFINKTIGYASILYPIFLGWWSLAFFRFTKKQRQRLTLATSFFLITAILFSATVGTTQLIPSFYHLPREWSGAIGQFLGLTFTRLIGAAGALIIYTTAFIVTLVFSIDLDIERTFLRIKSYHERVLLFSRRKLIQFWEKREARRSAKLTGTVEEGDDEAQISPEITTSEHVEEIPSSIASTKRMAEKNTETVPTPRTPERTTTLLKPSPNSSSDIPLAEKFMSGSLDTKDDIDPARDILGPQPASVRIIKPESWVEADTNLNGGQKNVTASEKILKTRPIPRDSTPAIPRLTRTDSNKLGERTNLLRLSNGALETPPSPSGFSQMSSDKSLSDLGMNPIETTDDKSISEDGKSDMPEALTKPERLRRVREQANVDMSQKVIKILPEVTVGNEKILSDEALPHSVTSSEELRDVVSEHQALSKIAAREADQAKKLRGADDFFEEGEKPFVPENPYREVLNRYKNPSVELLRPAEQKDMVDADDAELSHKGILLRDKLATFGVDIENITVTPGPVVTLYEFTPAEGVKVSRVENLTDDIALAMKARGIRIIAPIPGRGTIGVEIPNDVPKMVRIRSLFESQSFRNTKMNLPLALGKTISGDVYIDDLNKMPHLLIAGATGSGKSVGVNGILASLLYAKSPRDVKFVIVDPKKIELSLYKKLRKHYLIVSPEAGEDIVTTPAFAVLALKAVELEMEKRYDKLAKAGVRSLTDYNIKVAQNKLRSTQEEQHYHLPYIVVIIDELADLMITAGREIEEPICRIAQMARAVGIHLILATQRPSVDVITGVIKANFPARMAFQVATRVDSRTILDSMGAEQLLGNGDMLYQPSGTPKPIRLQSPFISTEEVEAIVDAVSDQDGNGLSYSRPWTLPSLKKKEGSGGGSEDGMRDELFEEAAQTIVRHQQGSVSLLQRRLKVGYSRAARIVDELEQAGIVGPFDGSKARQVLCENEEELELVLEGLR